MLKYYRDKTKARTVVGRGEKSPLCDPGSEPLRTWRERESSARTINGMKKKKKKRSRAFRCCCDIYSHFSTQEKVPTGRRQPASLPKLLLSRRISIKQGNDTSYISKCVFLLFRIFIISVRRYPGSGQLGQEARCTLIRFLLQHFLTLRRKKQSLRSPHFHVFSYTSACQLNSIAFAIQG